MSKFKDFLLERKENVKTKATEYISSMILGRHNNTLEDVKKNNPKELKMGIKIEHEHVPDGTPSIIKEAIATRIALDHLSECKTYYTRLIQMEKECGVKDDD